MTADSQTNEHDQTETFVDPFDATWRERVVVLGSLALAIIVSYGLGMSYARGETLELTALVPASFFVAGKFLPLWSVSGESNFGAYQLGLVIWAMDTFSVLIIVYALEGIYWIKPVKRWLERVQRNARLVLAAYPRMRRGALVGLVVFVLFPIAGTGAIGAAFIGVLLGIHRFRLIAAVSLGGFLGGMLMATLTVNFASALKDFQAMQKDPTLKYVILATIAVVVVVAFVWLTRVYRRALAIAELKLAEQEQTRA